MRPTPSRISTDDSDSHRLFPPRLKPASSASSASINDTRSVAQPEASTSRLDAVSQERPPPPPKRKPDLVPQPRNETPFSAPPTQSPEFGRRLHSRTSSMSHSGRFGSSAGIRSTVTPTGYNPTSLQRRDSNAATEFSQRISRVFADNKEIERTADWVHKAKESIVARTGTARERENLLEPIPQQHTAESAHSISSDLSANQTNPFNDRSSQEAEVAKQRPHNEEGWARLH